MNPNVSEMLGVEPQPKQLMLLEACGLDQAFYGGKIRPPICKTIGYGGSAGGGKSFGDLLIAITLAVHVPGATIAFFRRKLTDMERLDGVIPESQRLLSNVPNVSYNASKHYWEFPNGSMIQFCFMDSAHDKQNYYSSQFYCLIVDESTHLPYDWIEFLHSRNRSTTALPGHSRSYCFELLTSNPGNIGHGWYKGLFIANVKPYTLSIGKTPNGAKREVYFIPAFLSDNKILEEKDPQYRQNLEDLNPVLRSMLLDGNWDAAGGLYFAPFFDADKHIVDEIIFEPTWRFYGAVDYGFGARWEGELPWIYHLYGVDTHSVVWVIDEIGLAGATPVDQIVAMQQLEKMWKVRPLYRVGCRGMFVKDSLDQPTIAERYGVAGMHVVRTEVTSIENAEQLIVTYLKEDKLRISKTCFKLIDQLSNTPISLQKPNQTDAKAEDHAIETLYSFLSSRPATPKEVTHRDIKSLPTSGELKDYLLKGRRFR